ncbi:ATP-dependent DNA helicase [Clostridium sp. JS66]|uniref:ATP-dependent DNA helicase n=1 Tax=Clostridium sp. JS66 TaxID=3064705 RepID=UPI00298ED048|nr:helicase C-terminal domain-containing protein [Clostridium sp. JS66]WPC43099.1 helicase C-terminal domain-containing protein [Clostridium sp. JS66]
MDDKKIKVSIRNLVEFVLRGGDLDSKFVGSSRALEGTRAHQKLQKKYKQENNIERQYNAEVSLKYNIEYKGFSFIIEGRADGVIVEKEKIVIDEIKTVNKPLELIDENYNILHMAQAKCYAYIYAIQNDLKDIYVQLTYYSISADESKYFIKSFNIEELKLFFLDLLDKYFWWANFMDQWIVKRNSSIKNMNFPFDKYRPGQREVAVAVYNTIKQESKIFVQAPTGVGKTISTLFPAIKAMEQGLISKIFYLTAKTITANVAQECMTNMNNKGLKIKTLVITAKEKVCFKDKPSCNPEECEFAKGHYDRLNDALNEILSKETLINREVIIEYAKRNKLCPFEFSLETALWVDCIICDYNYAFNPQVYLKSFFENGKEDYVFLIDEAHNLADRGREMFSAELYKKPFLKLKKVMTKKEPQIAKALTSINSYMIKLRKICEEEDRNIYVQKEEIKDIYNLLRRFTKESEEWLAKNNKLEGYDELLQLYFDVLSYTRISEFYDNRFITYVEKLGDDIKIKIFCLDPSYLLNEAVKRGKAAVFFSATLSPISYFKEVLGGNEQDYTMRIPSPFPKENMKLILANRISTKYKNRESSYNLLVEYIHGLVCGRKGNYLIFFPSYVYMRNVYDIFCKEYSDINAVIQESSMSEESKKTFLDRFKNYSETMVVFAVLGGMFSEGIDLKGDKLIGVGIVGVGLPQLCFERDIIMNYFNDKNNMGYEYSYMYPGMNKVLQAAGRVIRTEEDRGIVMLMDERFSSRNYRELFPKHWEANTVVRNIKEVENIIKNFWENK